MIMANPLQINRCNQSEAVSEGSGEGKPAHSKHYLLEKLKVNVKLPSGYFKYILNS